MGPPDDQEKEEAEETPDSGDAASSDPPKRPRTKPRKHRGPPRPPWVADPNALALVQKAAKAIDLDVEALANLIVESGLTALPPSDGITQTYTLKDLGTRLWATMQSEPRNMRAKWFSGLTPTQQTAVIITLRDQGFATQAIANDFLIPPMEVIRTWNKHADDLGAQVVGIRLNTIAGNLQIVAERAQQGAMQNDDWSTVWRIQKDFTAVLQSLGITERAAYQMEVSHKFDGQKQAALNDLVALELKKERRSEEVKLIEATIVDEPPDLEEYE